MSEEVRFADGELMPNVECDVYRGALSGTGADVSCRRDPAPEPRSLLDEVRRAIGTRHLSPGTERVYVTWSRRFVKYHDGRHPSGMGEVEISAFLSHLATEGHVSANTRNQALSALLFLNRDVHGRDLEWMDDLLRARRPVRLPEVLTRNEVSRLLHHLQGTAWPQAGLLYGAGLRPMECARLRVKDIDLEVGQILVRDGKGRTDRRTPIPAKLRAPLSEHLDRVKLRHDEDLRVGAGSVALPDALARKSPNAPREWGVAVGLPGSETVHGSRDRGAPPAPHPRGGAPARSQGRGLVGGHREASNLSHVTAPLRDASAGSGLRHPGDPGTSRPHR
jgi:integrase